MSKNNKPAEKKQEKKVNAPKKPGAAPKTVKVEQLEDIPTEDAVRTNVATNGEGFLKKTRTLSPDAQVMALNLVHKTMVEPRDPALEMPLEVKNRISHRGRAVAKLVEYLKGIEN